MALLFQLVAGAATAAVAIALTQAGVRRACRRWKARLHMDGLAALRWRDGLNLLIATLGDEGYIPAEGEGTGSEGGATRLLRRGGQTILLVYKPGVAYTLGEASVQELLTGMRESGAEHGILATLGSITPEARAAAQRYGITLIAGEQLCDRLVPRLPSAHHAAVADRLTRQCRLPRIAGVTAALALGAVVALSLPARGRVEPTADYAAAADTAMTPPSSPSAVPEPVAVAMASTGTNPAPVPALPSLPAPEQRAQLAQTLLRELPPVRRAAWVSTSTLQISLLPGTEIDDILPALCALMDPYDALEGSRLQFDAQASGDSVRWRNCP